MSTRRREHLAWAGEVWGSEGSRRGRGFGRAVGGTEGRSGEREGRRGGFVGQGREGASGGFVSVGPSRRGDGREGRPEGTGDPDARGNGRGYGNMTEVTQECALNHYAQDYTL